MDKELIETCDSFYEAFIKVVRDDLLGQRSLELKHKSNKNKKKFVPTYESYSCIFPRAYNDIYPYTVTGCAIDDSIPYFDYLEVLDFIYKHRVKVIHDLLKSKNNLKRCSSFHELFPEASFNTK